MPPLCIVANISPDNWLILILGRAIEHFIQSVRLDAPTYSEKYLLTKVYYYIAKRIRTEFNNACPTEQKNSRFYLQCHDTSTDTYHLSKNVFQYHYEMLLRYLVTITLFWWLSYSHCFFPCHLGTFYYNHVKISRDFQ